jgi:hypothetical protein
LFVDTTSETANSNDTVSIELLPISSLVPHSFIQFQNLLLFSQYSCLAELQASENLSTGAVLLILFFVTLTVYLVGGMLFNIFFLGARGIEVVPNLDFWKGLPSLVHVSVRK